MQLHDAERRESEPEQIRDFLETGEAITFASQGRAETYAWAQQLLVAQEYACQGKKERGVIRAYLSKMTGLSMAQTARLIQKYRETGVVEPKPSRRYEFSRMHTDADIARLAELDRAHERLSGPATRCILQREYQRFGKLEYARLAKISVGHLYNLRNSSSYRKRAAVSIAERKKPEPKGRPGFLRVDTVHPGDWDGAKGVYHPPCGGHRTQWEVVEPCLPHPGQCFGGGQEWSCHAQKHRLRTHPERACRTVAEVLYGALQPAPQVSSTVRVRDGQPGCARQTGPEVQAGRLRHSVREVEVAARSGEGSKPGISWVQLGRMAGLMSDTESARKLAVAKAQLLRTCKVESPVPPRFS